MAEMFTVCFMLKNVFELKIYLLRTNDIIFANDSVLRLFYEAIVLIISTRELIRYLTFISRNRNRKISYF